MKNCEFEDIASLITLAVSSNSHLFHGWYNLSVLEDIRLGDVIRLRKSHPCGGFDWKVVRLGADIGLECCRCGRRVLLPRRELARRLKAVITRGPDGTSTT